MEGIPWGWLLAAAAVAVLALRRMSERSVEMPPGAARSEAESAVPGEDWEGEVGGEPFRVECLDGESWTVSVDAEDGVAKKLEVGAGGNLQGEPPDSVRSGLLISLAKEGAAYIDVGYNTDWVAAVFPARGKPLDRAKAERAAALLVHLREASL